MRIQIYAELGLPAPELPGFPAIDLETVREVLRNFRVPRELARSPLARGATVAERAESVQHLVWQAADEAFGDSETEKLLRSVLVAGYLEPFRRQGGSRLLLSRAAYFRPAADRGRAAGGAPGGRAAAGGRTGPAPAGLGLAGTALAGPASASQPLQASSRTSLR